ncbi:MAG: hypothetical protein BGO02_12245 [Brevundimonas sp. 67-6]|nr:MAG: hypothetical protein BGO02_12245 [Brevundimonas sp. 67-6]
MDILSIRMDKVLALIEPVTVDFTHEIASDLELPGKTRSNVESSRLSCELPATVNANACGDVSFHRIL